MRARAACGSGFARPDGSDRATFGGALVTVCVR
jgi:hypothetical protein